MFTFLYDNFTQDNMCQISSELAALYRRYDKKNFGVFFRFTVYMYIHCVSKKVPTFKLSVTLSKLNRFSKVLQSWKSYEICYKNPYDIAHLTLGPLLQYLGKLNIQISADI